MKTLSNREIQLGAYEVLKQLDQICQKNNIKYFLTYGTLIGAIRHKGIIPWDDDIDVMMPRPDYEKFKKYCVENASTLEPYKLFDADLNEKYPHRIARFSDQRFHLVFDNEQDYDIGLFVDIYPLDAIGDDYEEAIKLIHTTKKLASLCFLTSRKAYGVDNTDSKIKMLIKYPAYLYAKLKGNKFFLKELQRLSTKYSYEESKYVACIAWPAGYKYGRERDVFEKTIFDTILAPFEDSSFPIPVGYDEFLKTTYGDYMTLPDENGKKTHHTYIAYRR